MADRFDEMAEKVLLYSNIAFTSDAQIHEFWLSIATALRELAAAEREAAAKIADDYHEWTYWGQYDNAGAAEAAAGEIATAIRLGRPLTTDEISKLDTIGKTPLTGKKLREYQNGHKAGAADMRKAASIYVERAVKDVRKGRDLAVGILSLQLTTPKET